jgi:putative membrane protein
MLQRPGGASTPQRSLSLPASLAGRSIAHEEQSMTIHHRRSSLFTALLALGIAGAAVAQPAPGTASSSAAAKPGDTKVTAKAGLSAGERRFMETAARGGMAEVQLGKMAQDKAQDAQVKDFAGRMVTDHGKANDQLKQLATSKGVTLPAEPDAKHKRSADRLAKLSGAEFDRAYMKEMVDDHEKDVREFRDMSKSAKDAEVRSFASANLPTLEEHLKIAKQVHAATAKGGADKAASTSRSGAATGAGMASGGNAPIGDGGRAAGTTAAGTTPPGGAASGGVSVGGSAPVGTAGSVTSGTSGSTGATSMKGK